MIKISKNFHGRTPRFPIFLATKKESIVEKTTKTPFFVPKNVDGTNQPALRTRNVESVIILRTFVCLRSNTRHVVHPQWIVPKKNTTKYFEPCVLFINDSALISQLSCGGKLFLGGGRRRAATVLGLAGTPMRSLAALMASVVLASVVPASVVLASGLRAVILAILLAGCGVGARLSTFTVCAHDLCDHQTEDCGDEEELHFAGGRWDDFLERKKINILRSAFLTATVFSLYTILQWGTLCENDKKFIAKSFTIEDAKNLQITFGRGLGSILITFCPVIRLEKNARVTLSSLFWCRELC